MNAETRVMNNANKFAQLRSRKLWIDSISKGLAIFGVISAISTVWGFSFAACFSDANGTHNTVLVITATSGVIIFSYILAVLWQWWRAKDSITLKIRGIKVTIRQGDIFKASGLKVIGVDDTFSTQDDDIIINKKSLHGQFINLLRNTGKLQNFIDVMTADKSSVQLGSVRRYEDFVLLVMAKLDNEHKAFTDNQLFESTLRRMWYEIDRVYAGDPIYIPLLGTGTIRFKGVTDIPTPFSLLKCMLCTLKTSSVQIRSHITILVYDKLNEISLYDLKGV